MKAALACDALSMAVMVHSDRGSQYCSKRYHNLLAKHGLLASMSQRGECFGNACAESLFHTLKVELIHGNRHTTRERLRHEIFQYIETYYNTVRRHSALDYVRPTSFEQHKVA